MAYDPMQPPPRIQPGGSGSGLAPPTGGPVSIPQPPRATSVPSGSSADDQPFTATPLQNPAATDESNRGTLGRLGDIWRNLTRGER